jgi:hypothetical protein
MCEPVTMTSSTPLRSASDALAGAAFNALDKTKETAAATQSRPDWSRSLRIPSPF